MREENRTNIVLVILVVFLLAVLMLVALGAGYLWWQKVKVAEKASRLETQVAELNTRLEQQSVSRDIAETETKPQERTSAQKDELISEAEVGMGKTERSIGYIKKVYEKGGRNFMDIDYIQWFSGDRALEAMREDGECEVNDLECYPPNGYYIRNVNSKIRTYPISDNVKIYMQTYRLEEAGNITWDKEITFNEFKNIYTTQDYPHLREVPYWVEIESGEIVKITEQYVP